MTVNILSPTKVVVRTKASLAQIPGALGYMGILPGHAHLIAEIGVGELTLEGTDTGKQVYFVAGGYVDVADDVVTILVDVVEKPTDIDKARADKAQKRAIERLDQKTLGIDVSRAQLALRRAQIRLSTAQKPSSAPSSSAARH